MKMSIKTLQFNLKEKDELAEKHKSKLFDAMDENKKL